MNQVKALTLEGHSLLAKITGKLFHGFWQNRVQKWNLLRIMAVLLANELKELIAVSVIKLINKPSFFSFPFFNFFGGKRLNDQYLLSVPGLRSFKEVKYLDRYSFNSLNQIYSQNYEKATNTIISQKIKPFRWIFHWFKTKRGHGDKITFKLWCFQKHYKFWSRKKQKIKRLSGRANFLFENRKTFQVYTAVTWTFFFSPAKLRWSGSKELPIYTFNEILNIIYQFWFLWPMLYTFLSGHSFFSLFFLKKRKANIIYSHFVFSFLY